MPGSKVENPLDPSEAHLRRIRHRADQMWQADGRPVGQMDEYLERARELDALETNLPAAKAEPVVEEASLQENLGEFPALFNDQGDRMPAPETRKTAKEFRDGEH